MNPKKKSLDKAKKQFSNVKNFEKRRQMTGRKTTMDIIRKHN